MYLQDLLSFSFLSRGMYKIHIYILLYNFLYTILYYTIISSNINKLQRTIVGLNWSKVARECNRDKMGAVQSIHEVEYLHKQGYRFLTLTFCVFFFFFLVN